MSQPNQDPSVEDLLHQFRCEISAAVDLLYEADSLTGKLSDCPVSQLSRNFEQISVLLEDGSVLLKRALIQIQSGCEQWGDRPFSRSAPFAAELASLIMKNEEQSQQSNNQRSKRLVEGDSKKLTDNLIADGVSKPDGYQAHHIIPSGVANKSELMLNAIEIANFDIDCAANGIFLPPNILNDDLLPSHRGNHPRYSNLAEDILNLKWEELKTSGSQFDEVALMKKVNDTIEHLKNLIKTQGSFLRSTLNDL